MRPGSFLPAEEEEQCPRPWRHSGLISSRRARKASCLADCLPNPHTITPVPPCARVMKQMVYCASKKRFAGSFPVFLEPRQLVTALVRFARNFIGNFST